MSRVGTRAEVVGITPLAVCGVARADIPSRVGWKRRRERPYVEIEHGAGALQGAEGLAAVLLVHVLAVALCVGLGVQAVGLGGQEIMRARDSAG